MIKNAILFSFVLLTFSTINTGGVNNTRAEVAAAIEAAKQTRTKIDRDAQGPTKVTGEYVPAVMSKAQKRKAKKTMSETSLNESE